jgi:pyruvate dehydrogenase (quinone)
MVGTNFPYTRFLPEPGGARVVQIESDPGRQPVGDRSPGHRRCQAGSGRPGRAAHPPAPGYQNAMDEWRQKMEAIAAADSDPNLPPRLVRAIDAPAADDAIAAPTSLGRNLTYRIAEDMRRKPDVGGAG